MFLFSWSLWFEGVKLQLRALGVEELTTAESLRLRHYLEQILKENKSLESGDGYTYTAIGEPENEAVVRLLFDYGINVNNLPVEKGKVWWRDEPVMGYIRRKLKEERESQHQPYLD